MNSPEKLAPLDPALKAWLDAVIIPALLRAFLAGEKACPGAQGDAKFDANVATLTEEVAK